MPFYGKLEFSVILQISEKYQLVVVVIVYTNKITEVRFYFSPNKLKCTLLLFLLISYICISKGRTNLPSAKNETK
jgi:hypothetical protein